ncbi:MAG: hypothetical protein AAB486_03975 [Patescibacteria group bacterium]
MAQTKIIPIAVSASVRRLAFTFLAILSFAAPFLLSSSQPVTGTIVNAALFLSAVILPTRLFLPLLVLPSIATVTRGLVFGPLTPFLIYFLPFIWLGNGVLVLSFKKIYGRLGYFPGVISAAVFKSLLLFLCAQVYYHLHLVPAVFITTMGGLQIITAIFGGLLVYPLVKKIINE